MEEIPWDNLHSPNDNPAYEVLSSGYKSWLFEGQKHRLSGPAAIWHNDIEQFYLNGIFYNFKDWILNHPNIDVYLDAIGMTDLTERAIWKLKNI